VLSRRRWFVPTPSRCLPGRPVAADRGEKERIDIQRRIRDVIEARDGALLMITDDQKGELLRVTPASATSR
jgi:glucose/arabinose dehydrogenase